MPLLSRFRRLGKTPPKPETTDKQALELSDLSETGKQPGDAKTDSTQTAPWKALFFFTARPHATCLTTAIVSAVLSGLASPASALLVGKAFQGFASGTSGNALVKEETKYVIYMLGVGLGSWLLHFIFFAAWVGFGELQAKSARDRLFNGMLVKDIEWYDLRKNGVGALLPRLQVQIRELQLATAQPFGSLVTSVATACFNVGLAMFYSWKLTLVIVATIPLVTLILGSLGASMQPHVKKQQEKLSEALKHVNSALSYIETVKCFNGQDHEKSKYATAIQESSIWYMRVVNSNALQFAVTSFMASAMFVQGFYYGGVLVRNGEKNAGDVVTTFVAALGAFQAIASILPQMIVLEKGRTAGATLRAVINQIEGGPAASPVRGSSKLDSCKGSIELKNVSFAYPSRPDQMALQKVNLCIPGGGLTFIIGKSGSGKSTLGQLLMRFYTPELGEILFDDVPLAELDVTWLRNRITLVEQNSTLFEDTVFNNIALGRIDHHRVTTEEVTRAVEFALLQLMINDMPNGLDTVVGAKGNTMSGGQQQRMALARAYLRDTPVLMLDESTSALDQISRSLMMDAIRNWRRDRTTIIITHDISQVLPNDYAIIMEHGRPVQEGYRNHMERIKGSPFHGFLSEEAQLQIAPLNGQRRRSAELPIRRRSTGSPISLVKQMAYVDDPLEAHLTAGERSRASAIPIAFINKHTSAVLQGVGGFGRPVSTFRPSFINSTDSYSSLIGDGSNGLRDDSPTIRRQPTQNLAAAPSQRQNLMAPGVMENFLDKTGTLAAQVRVQGNRQRQRLRSEPTIHTASVEREDKRLLRKLRHLGFGRKSPEDVEVRSVVSILKTVWPNLVWRARFFMILGFICATIGAAAVPVFSFVLARLIQTYSQGSAGQHKALVYSLSILGIATVTAACAYLQHLLLEYAGQCWVNRIREKALKRILDQPRDFFTHEENSVSSITEGLDRHAEEMRNLLGRFAATVLTAFIMILVSLIWALITQWKITLIALSTGPYIYVVTRAFGTVSGTWEGKSNDAAEATSAIAFETFITIKTVRALTLEKHFSEKYFNATRITLMIGIKRALWSGFFYGLSDVSGDLVMALIFYSGAILVRDGAPATKIIEVFIQLIITINNVSNLLNFIPQMSAAKDMASRILRLSELPKDSHEHLGNMRPTTIGDIVFTDLSFSYPSRPDQTILNRVNLVIPSGKCTTIVGSSGSGKSTIAALLLNLYATTPDYAILHPMPDLMVSGRDIKHIHTPTLRSLIAVVAQSPKLFAATVADNIVYGLPDDSPYNNTTSIREAAAAAGIDDFIMTLPDGYATPVGEGGIGLSGGQAQRIAIARALVRKPAVLILDEATSALDVESAGLIRHTVHTLIKTEKENMTVIIITHSKDMMAVADNVVVLDKGEVVEQGGYNELLANKGEFRNLLSGGQWETDQTSRRGSVAVRGMTGSVDWG